MLASILLRSLRNKIFVGKEPRCIINNNHQMHLICTRTMVSQKSPHYAKEPSAGDKNEKGEFISNEPLKYFGSQAAEWRAKDSRSGGADEALWYQPYVISISLAIFLIYFCILREENDIDEKLVGSLFDHVHGLEEIQLTVNYKYNKENGLSTEEIEKRLTELGIDVKQLAESIGKK